jgi:hypothetical protein
MNEVPTRDVALCIELRERAILALMRRVDWAELVDRALYHPNNDEGGNR